jgi:NTP pyrophosphatase (non-canonical NTP hydrolase)
MNQRQLYKYFPSTNEGAKVYGGFMHSEGHFARIFDSKNSLQEALIEINEFLEFHGFQTAEATDFDETYTFKSDFYTVYMNPYDESQMILIVEKTNFAEGENAFITSELIKFRDARDWAQFHNSKDLSIALSIEANELLELFLWKDAKEVDGEKLKSELADIISYAFLLAEKHHLNIEEIVMEKIAENNKKYPVDKAKGNATKYDQL